MVLKQSLVESMVVHMKEWNHESMVVHVKDAWNNCVRFLQQQVLVSKLHYMFSTTLFFFFFWVFFIFFFFFNFAAEDRTSYKIGYMSELQKHCPSFPDRMLGQRLSDGVYFSVFVAVAWVLTRSPLLCRSFCCFILKELRDRFEDNDRPVSSSIPTNHQLKGNGF